MSPVFQDLKTFLHYLRTIGRNLEHINRFIKAGICIYLRTEFHPNGFQIINKLMFGKMLGSIECHMFGEMRQSLLIRIFQNRTGINHQPKLCPVFRFFVDFNVIPQTITEFAHCHFRIKGYGIVWIKRCYLFTILCPGNIFNGYNSQEQKN